MKKASETTHDFKIIPCESNPDREFLIDENRPDGIGVRQIGRQGRAWFWQSHVERHIKLLEKDLEFWREMEDLFTKWLTGIF